MALVTTIVADDRDFKSAHPTQVAAKYIVGERDGKTILQINTYGSSERQMPDKLSQTIQFDEQSARELYQVLKQEFLLKD